MLMSADSLALCYGLSCALAWGTGDFAGGMAARRTDAFLVVLVSQLISMAPLALLIWWLHEPVPGAASFGLGGIAGIFGAMGLIAFYQGLASGRMGLVAPLTAVLTASIPVVYSITRDGLPYPSQLLGFPAAALAVWLLATPRQKTPLRRREALLSLVAGCGFGGFFIFIHLAGTTQVLWPLLAARLASITLLGGGLFALGRLRPPPLDRLPLIAATGLLDLLGNALFILAAQVGRLDVSVVVSSLAPGGTVLLAWIVLKERLSPRQWAGVLSALAAIGLIAS